MNGTVEVDILLVEDNPADAELTIRALKKNKIANHIEWMKDGEEALDYLLNRNGVLPKVVLLDLRLPKVDGIDVLRAIREDEKVKDLPVVILTSSREDKDLVAAYDLRVNSYVRKPIDFNEFAKTVSDLGMYWLLVNEVPAGD